MKKRIFLAAIPLLALVAFGCGSSKNGETPGYTAKDFAKSPPPPQYRGPGQPGAPGSGPGGPPKGSGPINVPANIANGGGTSTGGGQ